MLCIVSRKRTFIPSRIFFEHLNPCRVLIWKKKSFFYSSSSFYSAFFWVYWVSTSVLDEITHLTHTDTFADMIFHPSRIPTVYTESARKRRRKKACKCVYTLTHTHIKSAHASMQQMCNAILAFYQLIDRLADQICMCVCVTLHVLVWKLLWSLRIADGENFFLYAFVNFSTMSVVHRDLLL